MFLYNSKHIVNFLFLNDHIFLSYPNIYFLVCGSVCSLVPSLFYPFFTVFRDRFFIWLFFNFLFSYSLCFYSVLLFLLLSLINIYLILTFLSLYIYSLCAFLFALHP